MNKVIIKQISIQNFKGIAKYTHDFDEKTNVIYAQNGEGKSTIKNAWEWCLCQQVDNYLPSLNNEEIPDLVTSVQITLSVNETEYVLCRESKGKYITNSDTGKKVKTSNENIYKLDGMELPLNSYKKNIASIIGDTAFENLIIITDKEFFNSDSTKWKWTDRRKLLLKMCNVEEVISEIGKNPKYDCIRSHIDKGYATSDIKSMLRKEKDSIKQQQDKNLILIEQKQKEIDEYLGIDFDTVSKDLAVAKTKLTKLNNSSKKENQSDILLKLQKELLDKTQELNKLKTEDSLRLSKLTNERTKAFDDATKTKSTYDELVIKYKQLEKEILLIIDEEPQGTCPLCGQPINGTSKNKVYEDLIKQRDQKEIQLSETQKLIQDTQLAYNSKLEEFNNIDKEYKDFKQRDKITELETQILDLKTHIEDTKLSNTNKLLDEEKTSLEETISSLEKEMAKKEFIVKSNKQIELWKAESKDIADKIIEVENKERALQDYVKEQTDSICNMVNSKFGNGITWSLYTMNYNGSLEETCECLYNGKNYSSLSTGEKNYTNLQVIQSLQEYFGVNLPVFSDNAEANTIPYTTDKQIIELRVKDGEKLKGCIKITDLY